LYYIINIIIPGACFHKIDVGLNYSAKFYTFQIQLKMSNSIAASKGQQLSVKLELHKPGCLLQENT